MLWLRQAKPGPDYDAATGSDAVAYAEAAAHRRADADAAWRELSLSTDRQKLAPGAHDPLRQTT